MKKISVSLILVVLMLVLMPVSFDSVQGSGYSPSNPIIKSSLLKFGYNQTCNCTIAGSITVLYSDGSSVVLGNNHAVFQICDSNSVCVSINVILNQTSIGTYDYKFRSPFCDRIVTVFVEPGMLSDDNGRIFPAVETVLGTTLTTTNCTITTVTTTTVAK